MNQSKLDVAIEAVLSVGLLVSATLLAYGLLWQRDPALRAGVLLLMATPAARVVVLTFGLALRKDWVFTGVSMWILGVLLTSLMLALKRAAL